MRPRRGLDRTIGGAKVFPEEVSMRQSMEVLWVAVALLVADPASADEKTRTKTLAEAVKEFNQRAQKDAIGKDQPALTEDEVIAAIRGWIRKEGPPATDEVYKIYQTIADTRKLPEGAELSFIKRWLRKQYSFDVWWVDLEIRTGPNTGYTFRIRDRKLRCEPVPAGQ
jgi:hypothetical protein